MSFRRFNTSIPFPLLRTMLLNHSSSLRSSSYHLWHLASNSPLPFPTIWKTFSDDDCTVSGDRTSASTVSTSESFSAKFFADSLLLLLLKKLYTFLSFTLLSFTLWHFFRINRGFFCNNLSFYRNNCHIKQIRHCFYVYVLFYLCCKISFLNLHRS